jgi:ATP-dependent Lon protease
MVKMTDGVRLIAQGLSRVRIVEIIQQEPYIRARVEAMPDVLPEEPERMVEVQAMARNAGGMFQKVVAMTQGLPDELQSIPLNVTDPSALADLIASYLPTVPTPERQSLLEMDDVHERLRTLTGLLTRELQMLEVGSRIQSASN